MKIIDIVFYSLAFLPILGAILTLLFFPSTKMREQLFRDSDPKWQHLIGKRVQFTSRDRLTGKNKQWVGKVEFIGINQLHGQFQVTVDRCPVWPVLKNTIKEVA